MAEQGGGNRGFDRCCAANVLPRKIVKSLSESAEISDTHTVPTSETEGGKERLVDLGLVVGVLIFVCTFCVTLDMKYSTLYIQSKE